MEKQKEKKVLSIGLIVLDVVAKGIQPPSMWKEKQRIGGIELMPGGDASNQSIFLAALGCKSLFNGCVGDDENGRTIRNALENRGVDTAYLRIKPQLNTGTALVLVGQKGDRTVFSIQGAHSSLCREDLPDEIPQGLSAITLGSLFGMPEAEKDGLEQYLRRAKEKGVLIFGDLDTARVVYDKERLERFAPLIDYFVPSEYDLMPFTGEDSTEKAVDKLFALGTKNIVIKRGEKGAYVYSPSFEGQIPALKVDPVDTTGAGDCMSAAFLTRILAGDTIERAAAYGCAAGSLCTLYPGANTIRLSHKMILDAMS